MASLKLLAAVGKRHRGTTASLLSVMESVSLKSRQPLDGCVMLASGHLSQGRKSLQRPPSGQIHSIHSQDLYRPELSLLIFGTNCENEIASLSQDTDSRQYICPSRLSQLFSQLVIGDVVRDVQSYYDCPISSSVKTDITTPATPAQDNAEILEPPHIAERNFTTIRKEAKEIMRIRHKKMKKHKLRKLRKRMYFLWKKQKAARKAKRDSIYWKEISDIKQEATDFDAESFVKDQLQKARKGGFYMKVLDTKSC